jgi:tetratricopeptide (TPR) repeat protein
MDYNLNLFFKMEVFMKWKFYTLIGVVISSLALSCKTASKLYQKGNYDEAVELAAKKLQKDPHDAKLLDIIQSSYRFAVEDHESSIRTNSNSTNELKWEWIYNDYVSLQHLYEAIHKVPQVYDIVHPVDYSSSLLTYGEKAGDTRYERGLNLMQTNNKQGFRDAYREFQLALGFKPGDMQIQQKMNEAYDYALVNIVILPVEESSFRFSSYNSANQNFDEQVVRNLQYNTGNEFVKFYTAWDAKSGNIRADEVIDMRFTNMNLGRYYDSKSKREVSKEVVTKEIVYKPDSVVKVYGKVYAQITTTTRTLHSEGLLQLNIRDGGGRWLWSDNFSATHEWSTQFASYTGDERALSENDKQLIKRREEQPPSEAETVRCLTDEINNNVLSRLRDHYSRS